MDALVTQTIWVRYVLVETLASEGILDNRLKDLNIHIQSIFMSIVLCLLLA